MTLMTSTDSQVSKAMLDLGAWQGQQGSPVFAPNSNVSDVCGEFTPLQDPDFTMDNTPSGSITPSDVPTPPNGVETVVNVANGTETPQFLHLVEESKPRVDILPIAAITKCLISPVAQAPVVEAAPVEEIKSNSKVQIRAPSTFDAEAPASTRLRHMIKNLDHILVCPGVYDGLSARIALSVGFEGMYMTGAGTNASRLGMADLGIAHLHDMRTNAEMIANLKPDGAPVIADMDTGYGGPMVIDRSLQQYHLAGVAGFHIEDQVMQKRCGHLQGKEVVDIDTYISRIKACVAAAKRLRSDIVIIARTDALQSRGYDDCIARLRRARDEGADMGILEGFSSKAQARQAVKDLAPWPLCLNSVENGVSPLISVDEAQNMGFRVVIFSFASLAPAYTAIRNTFEWLKEYGVTGSDVSPKTIFQVCGLQDLMVIDEQAGGNSFKKGV
jgi:methylisocitrate lyase